MSVEDARLQDALERLSMGEDFALFINHVAQRRNDYLGALAIADATNTVEMAKLQGRVVALDEVIQIRTDCADAKRTR